MNAKDRMFLLKSFEGYLGKKYGSIQKEVVFSRLMDTKRRFRADYVVGNTIIEINGGQWGVPVTCDKCGRPVEAQGNGRKFRVMSMGGRHNRAGSYENDLEKLNLAARNGFRVFQYTYEMLRDGKYKEDI